MLNNKIFKDSSIVCIYHSEDFDGICSAEIVRKYFSDFFNNSELGLILLKFIGATYGTNIDEKSLVGKVIICCDYTPENFKNIIKNSKYTIWIDHHKSSMLSMKDFISDNFEKVLSTDYSACEGVWRYFYSNKEVPVAVEYLSMFDNFSFTEDEKDECMCFQYGMKAHGKMAEIDGSTWNDVFESDQQFITDVLVLGENIKKYQEEHYDKKVTERTSRTTELMISSSNKKYRVIFINAPYSFSEVFKSIYDKDKHDIMMTGYLSSDKMWNYSFYCPVDKDIDVSLIAKEFGGGGHKGAAGCRSKDLLV